MITFLRYIAVIGVCLIAFAFTTTKSYPIDGYATTGIKRLLQLERIQKDSTKEFRRIRKGALLPLNCIKLNLTGKQNSTLNELLVEDPEFSKKLKAILPSTRGYSVTVMDMTNPDNLKYAGYNERAGYQPGSVGKIMVANALFTQLKKICPESWDARTEILKNKVIRAGDWALYDHHTVPIYDVEDDKLIKRTVRADDTFTLYEWVDHMMSVSNNGAASVVWREAVLMEAFGYDYVSLTEEQANAYWKDTDRRELTQLSNDVVNKPIRFLGITEDEWRLGSFFTSGANKHVGDIGGSIGTPLGLMKYLVQLEQGKVIDPESSLEIKRLLYMTDRRIRYAYSPTLNDAAVFFKSGSLYSCDRSNGQSCAKYAGNVYNYMNSVAIVEHPDGKKYLVCLMTNVLRKNSAYDHQALAGRIDNLVTERNAPVEVLEETKDES
jgi:hypothetical protein